MQISIIICTHNPRPDYLLRVLEALKAQTLARDQWELLLIDNASREPLAKKWDLSWHPHARHILEAKLGLTAARLRGIQEATGSVLVFIDDDNVVSATYLERVLELHVTKPWVAVWTAGNISPEFETPPAGWLKPLLPSLALNSRSREVWSNDPLSGLLPIGAGMCVQKKVGEYYAQQISASSLRQSLGRTGTNLFAGEDTDIGLCACDLGLAVGHAPGLQVIHLISSRRTQTSYLIRLVRDVNRSHHVLFASRNLEKLNSAFILKRFARSFLGFFGYLCCGNLGKALLSLINFWAVVLAVGDLRRLSQPKS